jgi:hypothetical protein
MDNILKDNMIYPGEVFSPRKEVFPFIPEQDEIVLFIAKDDYRTDVEHLAQVLVARGDVWAIKVIKSKYIFAWNKPEGKNTFFDISDMKHYDVRKMSPEDIIRWKNADR